MDGPNNHTGGRPDETTFAQGRNPIHVWLDASEIPWRRSRGDLIARYGMTRHLDQALPAVELKVPRRPVEGLIRPLYFQVSEHYSPHVPAIELFGNAYYARDEGANIRQVASELSAFLGSVEVEEHLNTLRAAWTFDRARVRLLVWPRDKQGPRSSRENDRDPRLALGCHLTIHTGFLPSTTEAEQARFENFVPICPLPPGRFGGITDHWIANQSELEFIREPSACPEIGRAIGWSSDRSALIFRDTDLFTIRMDSVQAIYVERTQPAKGPGGSLLQVEVRTDYPDKPVKMVTVCEAAGADDLNRIGKLVADAIGKPLRLSPYYADC